MSSFSFPFYNFIFQGYPEDIIITVKQGTKLNELIKQYFEKIQKSNLLLNNFDNIYFLIDAKIITYQNEETIEEFFKNNISSTFLVEVVNGKSQSYATNFEIIGIIKESFFSKVYRGKVPYLNENVAIKAIKKELIKEEIKKETMDLNVSEEKFKPYIEKFNKELNFMQKCQCENSVKVYDYYVTNESFIIIMELCDENLNELLCRKQPGFSSDEIRNILIQLNNVFKVMNKRKIVHRDLKLNNILVKYTNKEKTKYRVLLCDYGVSNQMLSQNLTTHAGTKLYMAPEILKGEPYTEKCDLWSLGINIYRMYCKDFPYKGTMDMEIYKNIISLGQTVLDRIREEDSKLKELLSKLLVINEQDRITWEDYYKHSFFN
jgi:serine/threonine protein kinase